MKKQNIATDGLQSVSQIAAQYVYLDFDGELTSYNGEILTIENVNVADSGISQERIKEIITEFGKEEFKRIFIELKIEGAAGETKLQRGLYITIKFKDKKNFEKAVNTSLKNRIYQKIINRSCISMPINISIMNFNN